MIKVFEILLMGIFFALLSGTAALASVSLQPGECISEPDNKVYLNAIKDNTNQRYNNLRNEIGQEKLERLNNTDSLQYYFCRIQCMDSNLNSNFLWVQMSDSSSRAMEMQGFQCPMVRIENVQIVGSIWGPQPVVSKFEAFTSNLVEVHNWLKSTSFRLSPIQTESRLKPALAVFQQVGIAFVNSNSSIMKTAGGELLEISALNENGKSLLLKYVHQLNEIQWNLEQDFSSPHFFVMNFIKTHSRFLQYSDLSFLRVETIEQE